MLVHLERDVTSRRRNNEDERQLFSEIISAIQVGLNVWELDDPSDPAGLRLIYSNPAAGAALGFRAKPVVGMTMRELFPQVVETDAPAAYAEVALGGSARSRGDLLDDAQRVFSVSIFPLGRRRVGVAFSDVTREREAQASALQTIETMSDAFFTLDREWRYTSVNSEAARVARKTREELLGKNIWELFPEAVGTPLYAAYQRAVRERVKVTVEHYSSAVDSWFVGSIYPTTEGLTVYFADASDRKKLEAQQLQARTLEAVEPFAGGVAHNFNNLLNVIDGYASLAKAELESESASIEHALDEIMIASRTAAALTSKLSLFSRKQTLETSVADVNTVVAAALDLAGPLIGEQIEVHQLLNPDAGSAVVDTGQIEQVILNLAINARDAMPGGGNLYIATGSVELDADTFLGLAPGNYSVITVRDDGLGMDEQTCAQIFEPFFTTKPVGEGSGLGLSTVYRTISQSSGHIDVRSTPGGGTTFTIYLPRSKALASEPRPVVSPVAAGRGEARILVVEDNEPLRALIVKVLVKNATTWRPREASTRPLPSPPVIIST